MQLPLGLLAAAVLISVISATNAFAQQSNCKSVQDPKARLECLNASPAIQPKAAADPKMEDSALREQGYSALKEKMNTTADAPNLDNLQWHAALDFDICSKLLFETERSIRLSGSNSPGEKDAYKDFYKSRDEFAQSIEVRFAALKQKLAAKENAEVALKELYIYWRAEMAPCHTDKTFEAVTGGFRLLLERVRVEASW
jgi:hypothetical protein